MFVEFYQFFSCGSTYEGEGILNESPELLHICNSHALSLLCITFLWELIFIACYNRTSGPMRKGTLIGTIDVFMLRYDWLGSAIRALKILRDWWTPVPKGKKWGDGLGVMLRLFC